MWGPLNTDFTVCTLFSGYIKDTYLSIARMAGVSFSELQNVKLKRTPPPKVPLGTNPNQKDDLPSDSGCVSVSAFRNRFEQKQTQTTRPHVGSFSRQDGGQPSVASARAKFEQKSVKKPPVPWKQINGTQSNGGELRRTDNNSNALKGEPPRKVLPPAFRIGTAPDKKPKPANLKFMLRKYEEEIVLSNGAKFVTRTLNKGKII